MAILIDMTNSFYEIIYRIYLPAMITKRMGKPQIKPSQSIARLCEDRLRQVTVTQIDDAPKENLHAHSYNQKWLDTGNQIDGVRAGLEPHRAAAQQLLGSAPALRGRLPRPA
jgi:hypothetical protein